MFLPLSLPEHFLPCTFPPTSKSEHVPSLVPFPSISFPGPSKNRVPLANTRTHASPPAQSTHNRCRPPSCAAWTEATSSCQTGGSRGPLLPCGPPHPRVASPPQLAVQQPQRPGQAGRQRRRRQRRRHHLLRSGRGAPHRRPTRLTRPSRPPPPRRRPRPATPPPTTHPPPLPPLPRRPARPRRHPPSARSQTRPQPPPPQPSRPRSPASRGGAPRSAGARS